MIEVLSDDWISTKIKKDFVFVDIYIKDTGTITYKNFKGTRREFAQFLGYDFYPTSIFINKHSEVVYVQPGYQDDFKYLNLLDYISSTSYEEIGIEEFEELNK
jgi:thioredoxin-related protein